MQKIKIYTIGKNKETWLIHALEEYIKRLKSHLTLDWVFSKSSDQLAKQLSQQEHYICLDPQGISMTSEDFSQFLNLQLIKGGSRLSFVIGGAEGLSSSIKSRSQQLISFSRLTFTHQIIRLILVEQLYRALEIQKGSGYHK